jgi:hypothetical protein
MTANQECIGHLMSAVAHIDKLLSNKLLNPGIKALFRLNGLSDADFASVIQDPLGTVQAQNWDERVGSPAWANFCKALGAGKAAKSRSEIVRKRAAVLNYARWIRKVHFCANATLTLLAEAQRTRYNRKSSKTAPVKLKNASAPRTTPSFRILVCTRRGVRGPGR